MVTWNPALVTELAERRVVLFLGAGVSKAAVPALPSWSALLDELSAKVATQKDKKLLKSLIRNGRYLDAAELVNSLTVPADRRAFFEHKFRFAPTPISPIYEDVLALDAKVCITTNYDQLIEKNFEHFSGGTITHQVRTYKYPNFLSDLRSPARVILKLHGCVTDAGSIVLDKRSFFNARAENPGIYDAVTALSTVSTILFLGYSMNDPDIQIVLEGINSRVKTDHSHFALVPKFEHPSLRVANMHTYNINFIEYPSGKHEEFPKALKELREAVQAMRASTGARA